MNGIPPGILTKIPNVGLALDGTVVVTLLRGDERHKPVSGSVWQIEVLTGKFTSPVSADTVRASSAPTFTTATANTSVKLTLTQDTFTMPSLEGVVATATMSATAVAEADTRRVLTPGKIGAAPVLAHLKLSCTSVGANGAEGTNPKLKRRLAPGGMSMEP